MNTTYIFGHKKPDTDSVMSAIGLSYLENSLGKHTEPRILGPLNKETKYALNYFKAQEPHYLNDVKLQLKDINYHKDFFIKETDSLYKGYQLLLKEGLTGLPIILANGSFSGLITIKDLSETIINENSDHLYTSYANLISVLKGEEILKFSEEISGELLVAAYRSTTFMHNVKLEKDMILIVGDRHSIIEYAVKSGVKLLIIVGSGEIKQDHLEIARKNKVNIIRTSYDTYHVTRLVAFANYIKTMVKSYNPVKFFEDDFVDDVLEINNKLRHTNYPIVNSKNKCLGLLRITDLADKHPKDVILVDHNEKLQSADGIEEANILAIIDHHNLGNITTTKPIDFRNMAVGSTSTIIYKLFKEKNVTIPPCEAGLLLSGILSDTLILKSPTATLIDYQAVQDLATIAQVDYERYGLSLVEAGTSLEGLSKEEVLYNDFKLYNVGERTFAIGQFFTMNFSDLKKDLSAYVKVLDNVTTANNYRLVLLYVTDILKNGSYVIYNSTARDILELAYDNKVIEEGFFLPNVLSRKKHIVPIIMNVLENEGEII